MLEEHGNWMALEESVDLRGILKADGITDGARDATEMLVAEYASHLEHNQTLKRYYDGKVKVADYGVTADIANDQTCGWPEKVVSAWAQRITLERFALPPEATDEEVARLASVVDRNSLVSAYNRHVPVKGLYGCMAATVNRSADGRASVRFHGATTFTAIPSPDFEDGVVAAGLAIARREYTPWSRRQMVPTIVNLHLPHNVGEFRQVASGEWVYTDGPMSEELPTLFVFAHRAVGCDAPFGRTRITKFVRTLTDDAIRCMFHMQVSSAFYSMAKMYILGLTDDQFDAIMENKTGYQMSRLLALTTNEQTGENPLVGQLSGNSPQPFIEERRDLATELCGLAYMSLDELGIVHDNPTSAQAMEAAKEGMKLTCARDIESDKATLRRVMRAALAIEGNTTTDELPEALKGVRAEFANPVTYSMNERSDWGLKVSSVVEGFGETTVGMRMMGIPEEDIPTVQSEIRANLARQAAMAALMPRQPQAQPQQDEADDADTGR